MSRTLVLFFLASIVLMAFTGCGGYGGDQPQEYGDLAITVKDINTGATIGFASIAVLKSDHNYWDATGGNGVSIISNIPVNSYSVECYASGYENLVQKVDVKEGDNSVDLYMEPTPLQGDSVPPYIVYRDADSGDLWLMFSERMNKQSVEDAISLDGYAEWKTTDPCDPNTTITDSNYTFEWNQANILHIAHAEEFSKTCYDSQGNPYIATSPWVVDKIVMFDTATDYNGNKINDKFIYP